MGMYDNVYVNLDKLPLTDEEKKLLGEGHAFQTKDFNCILTDFIITDDGHLKVKKFRVEVVPREERPQPIKKGIHGFIEAFAGAIRKVDIEDEIIPFHGWFNFYTLDKNERWYEFDAKFTDGILQCIERIKDEKETQG